MSTRDDIRRAKEKLDQFLSESSGGIAESKVNKDAVDAIVKAAERLSKAEQERRWNWQAVATPITMLTSIVAISLSTFTTYQANESAKKSKAALEKQTQITRAESAIALALEHSEILYGDNVPTQTWSTALQQIQQKAEARELDSVAEGLAVINNLVLIDRKTALSIPVDVSSNSDFSDQPPDIQAQDVAAERIQDVIAVQPRVQASTTSAKPLSGSLIFFQGFDVPDERRNLLSSALRNLGGTTFPWQSFAGPIPHEVRYYFPKDRAIAEQVAIEAGKISRNRLKVILVRNSEYLKKAKPGLIEVWLNETGAMAASAAAP